MTDLKLRWAFILIFIVTGIFVACESTTHVDGVEESLQTIPNLNLVEGAENIVATVNRDRDKSNFKITLDGMKEVSGITPGQYDAFCALWDVPINSENGSYGDVSLYSIEGESYWQGINYLINNLETYYKDNKDLTWLEVQIALWSVMDHKTFDLNTIPESDLPVYVKDGDYNSELIDMIIEDVEENKELFDSSEPGMRAFYVDVPGAQDQIIILPGLGDLEKGFGVRFRNFSNPSNTQELFLGVGDLGAGNRTDGGLIWNQNGTTEIDFVYIPAEDKITASAGNTFIEYENLSANMPSGCSIQDVDRAQLWVAARDAGTSVTLQGTYAGETMGITAENGVNDNAFLYIEGIDFSGGFSILGEIVLSGTFSSSQENGKVDLILGCPK